MRLILIGPPGVGKGTQGVRLARRYRIAHVATGDLLRDAVARETELGLKAKEYMEAGNLVPDVLVLELLRARLSQPDARVGFVLDGFPRNPAQAEALNGILAEIGASVDAVVSLEVDDDIVVERLSSRATCPTCGATYRVPPLEAARCDRDRTVLVRRKDDDPDLVRHRLVVFRAETSPLIDYYERQGCLVRVDGIGDVAEVEERIVKHVETPAQS